MRTTITVDAQALYMLLNALAGARACATDCGSCAMSRDSAAKVLRAFEQITGVSADDAYYGRTVANNWRDGTIWDESGLPVGHSPLPR